MNCPACARLLTTFAVEGVDVDACVAGCGGLWFDNFELKRFDEPHETVDDALLTVPMDPTVHVDPQAKRRCPKCNVAMMRHYFNQLRGTHLDSCPQCGGNWLDAGELAQVRVEFRAQSARDAAKQQPVINKHLKWFVAEE